MDHEFRSAMREGHYQRCFNLAQKIGMEFWFEAKFPANVVIEYVYSWRATTAKTLKSLAETIFIDYYSFSNAKHWASYYETLPTSLNYSQREEHTAKLMVYYLRREAVIQFGDRTIAPLGELGEPWIRGTTSQDEILTLISELYANEGREFSPKRRKELEKIVADEMNERQAKRTLEDAAYEVRKEEKRQAAIRKKEEAPERILKFREMRRLLDTHNIDDAIKYRDSQTNEFFKEIASNMITGYLHREAFQGE